MKTQFITLILLGSILFACSKETPFEDLPIEQQIEGTWLLDSLTYEGEANYYSLSYEHSVDIKGKVINSDYQLIFDSEAGLYHFTGEYLINIRGFILTWELGQTGINSVTENQNYQLSDLEDSDSFTVSEDNRIIGLRVSNGKDPYLEGIGYTIQTLTEEELVLSLLGGKIISLGEYEDLYTTTGKIKFKRVL